MARRVLKNIDTKLNFLWRQSNSLIYSSTRLLYNALIQPHFDYGCTSWYPIQIKALKTKLQTAPSKCILFCLELPLCGHINPCHFMKINWLSVEREVELCTPTTVFKYWKGIPPSYLNDMFMPSLIAITLDRRWHWIYHFEEQLKDKKIMSFLGPQVRNKVSSNIKTAATIASFTHPLKKEILSKLQEWTILLIFFYYYYYCYFCIYLFFQFFETWLFFYYIFLRSYL